MKRKFFIRIHVSLLSSLMLIIILLAGTMLLVSFHSSTRVVSDLVKTYMEKTSSLMQAELDSFFSPVNQTIRQVQHWSKQGIVQHRELEPSNHLYIPIMQAYPQITSIAAGYADGYSYRIGLEDHNYLSRLAYAGDLQKSTEFALWDQQGNFIRQWFKTAKEYSYDARTRDWYEGAQQALQIAGNSVDDTPVFWAAPFRLKTSKMPGISASLPLYDISGEIYMATFNVMLTKLSAMTSQLYPSPNGKAFVITEDAKVIGFPAHETFNSEDKIAALLGTSEELLHIRQLEIPALTVAAQEWEKQHYQEGNEGSFRYQAGKDFWWTSFKPYQLSTSRTIWIGVAVPEKDFLGEIRFQQMVIMVTAVIAMIAAIILALYLAHSYSVPIRRLVEQSLKITHLDLQPQPPIKTHILETHQLAEAHEQMRLALESFSRYVPIALVKQLLRQGEAARLGGKTREITIMFTDIRGFTTISEQMHPDALSQHLSGYFRFMLDLIAEHNGTVDKMVGDAIMAFWGAPQNDSNHVYKAVVTALACARKLQQFNQRCIEPNLPPLETGFGLSTGQVMVGNVGTRDRLNYTALGDHVNLAARLEGTTKMYGTSILVSETVRDQVRDQFHWRMVDLVAVKGKKEPVRIYEPLGLVNDNPPVTQDRIDFAKHYEKAYSSYLWRDFSGCISALNELHQKYPQDLSIQYLLKAAKYLHENPPDENWDGVNRLMTK